MIDESSPWVLDITDVYYNIALVGKEQICANLKNDIMVSHCITWWAPPTNICGYFIVM